eukprot:7136993-Pyramimonas_sp.AAC.1
MASCKFKYDRRKKQGFGLCAAYGCRQINVESSPIEAGDQLPPQPGLQDVAKYHSLPVPQWVRFWRRSAQTLTAARNALLDKDLGISIVGSFGIDYMHTVCLGVMASIILATIWGLASEAPCFGSTLGEKAE